jgi:hypothetical protein
MIEKFKVRDNGDGTIGLVISSKDAARYGAEIKAHKAEILAELRARAATAEAERKAGEFRRNVPGLDELRAAIAENERNYERQRKDIEMGAPRIHTYNSIDTDALRAKYPAAAAYLKAEGYWMSNHYAKSSAGKKAMEIIAAGGDYKQAIADMEAEWKAHCEQHLWD